MRIGMDDASSATWRGLARARALEFALVVMSVVVLSAATMDLAYNMFVRAGNVIDQPDDELDRSALTFAVPPIAFRYDQDENVGR